MAQNLPSQKIHTTEITAVTISQDGKFITSFSKLDEIVALWNYPTGLNTPVTLELNYLKKNKKVDIKMIIDTKNKVTCEFDLTMSKKLLYDNHLFIILYSSECDKPMILDDEMEYFSPDCLKDVFGRAEFLADGEMLVFTLNPLTNKNYAIFRQWEPHNIFDVIDIDTGKCYLRIMPAQGETTYKISNMRISSAGDLLAFKTSLGGLHVYDLCSGLAVMSKKLIFPCDFQFVNGGKNLLIINFDKKKEHILATLYNARSGTELAHVALSQSNTKNVRIINEEQLLVVSSNLNHNILIVDEWNWINMFRKQPIQYTDVFTSNYKDDRDLITGYKVEKYPSFSPSVKLVRDFLDVNVPLGKLVLDESCSEYVISSRSLQIRFASGVKLFCIDEQNIILVSSRMIILFYAIDNDMRKLVWRPPHYLLNINKFSYQCINDFSNGRILWIDITYGDSMKNYYTIIPLDVAISGHDLPDEWMQHSCECQGPRKSCSIIIINQQFGFNGENPLTIAILEFKSVEIQQLLDYCMYHCIHDGQPGFMSIVIDALPELARHYPKILDKLMKQCTCVKIPPIIWKLKPEKYDSIHENLWGDKFDAFILPVITGSLKHGDNVAPSELQSLSVLSLWIFVAAQLRVFKGIGVIIAAFILFAFANSLMILLLEDPNFTSFDNSLKNVWSMFLCDYDSLKQWTDNRLVDIYKIVFSFSTTIILMNILIAILSDTYEKTINYARTVWVIKRAEIIIDIELSWMMPSERQNRNYFPWSIIYEAFTEDVDKWSKKSDAPIPCEMNDEVKDVIAKIRDEIDEIKDEIIKFKDELKQSLSEFQKFHTKVVEQEIK
ncbi:hypothetical protein GLOIN_2v1771895 [Rhizophagus irregularis DAOM 181602=DAOM 197198]|nr:hypothetical protein GLOIN_2v1771895 [Rhizophagus irregularis DAOM 181602=DAOM 197198]CAG8503655.1 3109_t:CDS:2 [Rhizophagus irregularis]